MKTLKSGTIMTNAEQREIFREVMTMYNTQKEEWVQAGGTVTGFDEAFWQHITTLTTADK